jgi:hypothetical protein
MKRVSILAVNCGVQAKHANANPEFFFQLDHALVVIPVLSQRS